MGKSAIGKPRKGAVRSGTSEGKTRAEVMQELESYGTEQNRKIYRRHGAPGPLFGVSFANLNRMQDTGRRFVHPKDGRPKRPARVHGPGPPLGKSHHLEWTV